MSVAVANPTADLSGAWLHSNKVQTTTVTGTQNNLALTGTICLHLRCNNATALTITGLATSGGNLAAAMVVIDNVGTSTVKIAHQNASSTAANRCICPSTNGQILGAGGRMVAVYDSTQSRWLVTVSDPGAWIAVTYASGDYYGSGSMTWTVGSGDLTRFRYRQHGTLLHINLVIQISSVGGTPSTILIATIPAGFTVPNLGFGVLMGMSVQVLDNNVARVGAMAQTGTASEIGFIRADVANWTASTNLTAVSFQGALEIA